ncbi:hypothetical protein [Pontibacter roseus]|uniref:hypothetical protein n=1 Tax=Pontibacter roseus TaxID=336989 RepID=UPI0012FB4A58|nr:hypothetical protein [Pontibacter roseus]
MKSILQTLVALVAAGKSNLSGWYILLALLILSVLLSGCAQQEEVANNAATVSSGILHV